MSIAAEFATEVHSKFSKGESSSTLPFRYPSRLDKLYEVKAVVFDVYGTLVNYYDESFLDKDGKNSVILNGFKKTSDYFGLSETLTKMNPADIPEATLRDFYHGLISINHDKNLEKNISFPEVKVEGIWKIIIMMLERHGYSIEELKLGNRDDVAKCMAFYYNFHTLGRGFFEGVTATIQQLKENNIRIGIVSNGQFYTPLDLTLFLRDQSGDIIDDYLEVFDTELTFFSYEYNAAKPGRRLFEKLFDSLQELNILPSQVLYVGNDLSQDIKAVQEIGMNGALFTGNKCSTYLHDLEGEVIPDLSFAHYDELPEIISFYREGT